MADPTQATWADFRHLPEHRRDVERAVLGRFIVWPYDSEWHLAGLEPALFADRGLREIARIVCRLRDAGRLIHWRRVRWMARRRHPSLVAHFQSAREYAAVGNFDAWFGELVFLSKRQEAA